MKENLSVRGKSVGEGTATVEAVTISGASYAPVSAEVVINLAGNSFVGMGTRTDLKSWFKNMPTGLMSAKPKNAVPVGATTITITVSGTPDVGSAQDLEIIIPEGALQSGSADITVDPNPAALYDITAVIKNLTDFQNFANAVNGGDVKQNAKLENNETEITVPSTADYIPIARDWYHVGKYTGTFDGSDGKVNIALEGSGSFLALFGVNNGTIQNLTVAGTVTLDEKAADADYIAGVVAYNDIEGHINNVISKVNVTAYDANKPNNAHNIGGIAGFNGWDQYNDDSPHADETPPEEEPGGTISQCRNDGDVEGGFNKIGGIAGENAGVIEQCANTGKITDVKGLNDRGWPGVGGIVGRNGNNNTATEYGHILNCYNWGTINDNAETGASKNAYGGITGWCDTVSNVKNCYTTGEINQKGVRASSGEANPIIGTVDSDPENTDNNYSLDSIFASSEDTKLIGIRKEGPEMKTLAFVALLNTQSGGPYVLDGAEGENYPILSWEQGTSKK
jgi:hypothetical protein